jgi:hypothetical protein
MYQKCPFQAFRNIYYINININFWCTSVCSIWQPCSTDEDKKVGKKLLKQRSDLQTEENDSLYKYKTYGTLSWKNIIPCKYQPTYIHIIKHLF